LFIPSPGHSFFGYAVLDFGFIFMSDLDLQAGDIFESMGALSSVFRRWGRKS